MRKNIRVVEINNMWILLNISSVLVEEVVFNALSHNLHIKLVNHIYDILDNNLICLALFFKLVINI